MSAPTDFVFVSTEDDLVRAAASLEGPNPDEPRPLYIDTEFESSKRGTRLCLIQISAGETAYLIDPLQLSDLSHLAEVLTAPGVSWVLHAGMQDVKLLTEELRIEIPQSLFDTQIAWALLGPEASVSLAYVQYKVCGVRSAKGHQADDWERRPLPNSQLRYAAADVLYLPKIYQTLSERAEQLGRRKIIEDASKDALSPEKAPPAPLRQADFRNAWQLDAQGQAALTFLIEWYNGLPQLERQYAPENKTLLALAARKPRSIDDASRIKGVSHSVLRKYGAALLSGITSATKAASSGDFVPLEPPAYATFEEIRLDAWLQSMRAAVCERLQIAPELVLPGRQMKAMMAACEVEGLAGLKASLLGWRRALVLDELSRFCEQTPPPL